MNIFVDTCLKAARASSQTAADGRRADAFTGAAQGHFGRAPCDHSITARHEARLGKFPGNPGELQRNCLCISVFSVREDMPSSLEVSVHGA